MTYPVGFFTPKPQEKKRAGEKILFGNACLFSAGQILTQVPVICGCVRKGRRAKGEEEGELSAPDFHGIITVSSVICSDYHAIQEWFWATGGRDGGHHMPNHILALELWLMLVLEQKN